MVAPGSGLDYCYDSGYDRLEPTAPGGSSTLNLRHSVYQYAIRFIENH